MKIQNLFFLFGIVFCCVVDIHGDIADLMQRLPAEVYQDVLINGSVIKEGLGSCELRLPFIKQLLDNFERPITVLDIGAGQGYFSLNIAAQYPATCVMIEGNKSLCLPEICKYNTQLNNIVVLEKSISVQELQELGKCEHFDVVLALNVIHHFGNQWKDAAEAIMKLGNYAFIETPPPGCKLAPNKKIIPHIDKYLNQHSAGSLLAHLPRYNKLDCSEAEEKYSSLYLFSVHKNRLTKAHWGDSHRSCYNIIANFTEKKLIKSNINRTSIWQPGINLWTFRCLNGVYPDYETIKHEISRLATVQHPDFTPRNIIIQGDHLALIDWEDETVINYRVNYCLELFNKKIK